MKVVTLPPCSDFLTSWRTIRLSSDALRSSCKSRSDSWLPAVVASQYSYLRISGPRQRADTHRMRCVCVRQRARLHVKQVDLPCLRAHGHALSIGRLVHSVSEENERGSFIILTKTQDSPNLFLPDGMLDRRRPKSAPGRASCNVTLPELPVDAYVSPSGCRETAQAM